MRQVYALEGVDPLEQQVRDDKVDVEHAWGGKGMGRGARVYYGVRSGCLTQCHFKSRRARTQCRY